MALALRDIALRAGPWPNPRSYGSREEWSTLRTGAEVTGSLFAWRPCESGTR